MTPSLAFTALLMGLVGGPHCVGMCGAACGGVVRGVGARPARGMAAWLAGRLLGYAAVGAVCGLAAASLAWLAAHAAALRPAWTLFHLAVLAWGLVLLAQARQPAWIEAGGRRVWARVRPLAQRRGGLLATGALWVFMPCGLLYSALLVASLAGGALGGATAMALFALGSSVSLGLAPGLLRRLQAWGNGLRQDWGTRAAGGLLVLAAAWALWMDVAQRVAGWCVVG